MRGAFYGTMLRNEIFDFCNLGTFVERADNTARILDVKYWVLLPDPFLGRLLARQLSSGRRSCRSVSAHRSYASGNMMPTTAGTEHHRLPDASIERMPRSLAYCYN